MQGGAHMASFSEVPLHTHTHTNAAVIFSATILLCKLTCSFLLVCFLNSLYKCSFLPFSTMLPHFLWQMVHFAVSHADFILPYSPTSQAPEACLQCLDFLVPSGHLRVMFMKAAAPSVPRPNTQPTWRTRQLCVSRNTIRGLTPSVPTWTWTYGLQQPIEMQISHFRGTRVTVEMCERHLV